MPGLIDTHVHLAIYMPTNDKGEVILDTLSTLGWILAGGVTTVRDAYSNRNEQNYQVLCEANTSGKIVVPRIYISSLPDSAAMARLGTHTVGETIERLRHMGVNGIKVIGLLHDKALEVIAAAGRAGMPVYGHISAWRNDTTWENFAMSAARAGISGIMHVGQLRSMRDTVGVALPISWGKSTLAEKTVWNLLNLSHWINSDVNSEQVLIDTMVSRSIWLEPTLTVLYSRDILDSLCGDRYDYEEVRRYYGGWPKSTSRAHLTPQQEDSVRRICRGIHGFIQRFYQAGGLILAGTDFVPSPPVGVAEEIRLLVKAGLPPIAALRAATINAARALQMDDQIGAVEEGKLADLLILNDSPIDEITNVRKVWGVVANGRYLDRAALDTLLATDTSPVNEEMKK